MKPNTDLLELALRLPERDRAELAHRLLASLEPPETEQEANEADEWWANEIERRAIEVESGDAETVDAREAVERIRASLRSSAKAGDAP